ncbi:PLDc N-terminal domain-containing protein [Enteractinococcus helveticum]|uniref:Cardiolipin synthase N-terminal domain-containing protein n=1 Tax=Enteractinococcus helveticum TaxID=1837282 RepID=A0A1B7M133_9MICC|nr:PLDc N-terminal domain-containing protein [Enteractinococcus helveticum]OAV62108.1 hypothetical protein A6F49_07370 [Enteractinococcus helveticum]
MIVIDTVWEVFWWCFFVYLIIAFLFALFTVIRDLFRDHELNGWAKAGWLVLLIFVPIITLLIYVIVRGEGMHERSEHARLAAKDAIDQYIRHVAGASPADEIEKAKALLLAGSITESEYQSLKAKAMA